MSDILRKWHEDHLINNPNFKVVMLPRDIARIWLETNKGIAISPPISCSTVKQYHFEDAMITHNCLVWNKRKIWNNRLIEEFIGATAHFYRDVYGKIMVR